MVRLFVFIATFLFFLPSSPRAQDLLSNQEPANSEENYALALKYRDSCLGTMYQDLTLETRDFFCSCTADYAHKSLTQGELETLVTGTGDPVDPLKLNLSVIAPCLSLPMGEIEYDDCLNNPKYSHFFKTQDAYDSMCGCLRDRIVPYVEEYGVDMVDYIQTRLPSDESIILRVKNEFTYRSELNKGANDCISKFGYK